MFREAFESFSEKATQMVEWHIFGIDRAVENVWTSVVNNYEEPQAQVVQPVEAAPTPVIEQQHLAENGALAVSIAGRTDYIIEAEGMVDAAFADVVNLDEVRARKQLAAEGVIDVQKAA